MHTVHAYEAKPKTDMSKLLLTHSEFFPHAIQACVLSSCFQSLDVYMSHTAYTKSGNNKYCIMCTNSTNLPKSHSLNLPANCHRIDLHLQMLHYRCGGTMNISQFIQRIVRWVLLSRPSALPSLHNEARQGIFHHNHCAHDSESIMLASTCCQ